MKLAAAQKVLGYDIDLERTNGSTWSAIANWEHGQETVTAKDQGEAIEKLVDRIYKLRSLAVMKRQGYVCHECGDRKPLQIHHRKFRSKGRVDTISEPSNLVALCADCHQRAHNIQVRSASL